MKKTWISIVAVLAAVFLIVGCSGQTSSSVAQTSAPAPAPSSAPAESSSPVESDVASAQAEGLLQAIAAEAARGMVIDCEYAVDSVTIDVIESAWGTADSEEFIADAKGTYYTFNGKHVVFGVNKGMLVFEVRSYSPKLDILTHADVVGTMGEPEHTSTTASGELVIGYTIAYTGAQTDMSPEEVKLEFVFPAADDTSILSHYNVLDPTQTANLMADDTGREW